VDRWQLLIDDRLCRGRELDEDLAPVVRMSATFDEASAFEGVEHYFRLANDLAVEHWGVMDTGALMQQLTGD
jgi:hypothetical protein